MRDTCILRESSHASNLLADQLGPVGKGTEIEKPAVRNRRIEESVARKRAKIDISWFESKTPLSLCRFSVPLLLRPLLLRG